MKFSVNGKIYDLNVIASRCGEPAQDEENYIAQLRIDVKEADTERDVERDAWVVDKAEWGWIVYTATEYAERKTADSVEGWEYEAVVIELRA